MKKAILAGIFLSYSVIANTTVIEFNNINSYVLKKVDGKQLYKNLKSEVSRTQIVKKITQDGEVTTLNSSQNTTPIFDEDLLSLRFEGDYADGVVQLSAKSEVDFMNDLDKKVETDDALGSLLYRTLIRPFIKYFVVDSIADENTTVTDSGKVIMKSDEPVNARVKTSIFYKHGLKSLSIDEQETSRVLGGQIETESELAAILTTVSGNGEFESLEVTSVETSALDCKAKRENLNCTFNSKVTVEVKY